MNLLDIHFCDGRSRTIENIDHCECDDVLLTGYRNDGRLLLRVLLTSVDWIEVREARTHLQS